ncbi:MAG TPA: cytochrome c [Phenylobacterium sp.]|jgi:mono/diheme cytochrome c family protein|nr:cytochrome c [Phenylobacterium sp.]
MWRILGAIAALSAGAQTAPSPAASPDPASRGLYVALRVCSACHKVAFPGVGPDSAAPSFAAIHARHDAEGLHSLLVEISSAGHQEMPPIPMSPAEIEDVAAYIATVPPAPPAVAPHRDRRRGPASVRRIAIFPFHAAL